MDSDRIDETIRTRSAGYDGLARSIWENPEISGCEIRSSAIHRERLSSRGFSIVAFPELAHSFSAERGQGGPVVAFMGEYDALPGMAQSCRPVRDASTGGAGHACGHNLLGVGSLAAAEALAEALEATGMPGRVRYYGCPAEEATGRIPLVKAGRFDDVDLALTWHPADVNTPHRYTTSANLAMTYRFTGRASHAGMAPHAGRSALDAVQLMNLGLEFLREHVERGVLVHYVITDGGANANIVPEHAASSLYLRAPRADSLRAVAARVEKIARGAALMTETRHSRLITHGKCDYIPNDAVHDRMLACMQATPLPRLDAEELAFARALAASVGTKERSATLLPIGAPLDILKKPVHAGIGDFGRGMRIGGSLDTGDVSYVVPTGQLNAAAWPAGVGAHTWQSCAASGSTGAFKAMRWAAAILAKTGFAFMQDAGFRDAVRSEFEAVRTPYRSTVDQ